MRKGQQHTEKTKLILSQKAKMKTGKIAGRFGKKHTKKTKAILSKKAKLRTGKKGSNWKGGRVIYGGYVYVYSPDHPNRTQDKYVAEHRLVMEDHLGRYLKKTEIVHHINDIKNDNRIDNLKLFSSIAEHVIEHDKERNSKGQYY